MSTHVITPNQIGSGSSPHQGQHHSDDEGSKGKPYPSALAKYEEVVQSSKLFWETLQNFHQSLGRQFKAPTVGESPLDLHRLFVEVTSRGGISKIISDRRWKEVVILFKFPASVPSPSLALRCHYMGLLYHYEQVYYFRKQLDTSRASVTNESAKENGCVVNKLSELQVGSTVIATMDAKCDYGYCITVNLGCEQLKGVLFHAPQLSHASHQTPAVSSHGSRRSRDPSRPKSNRSGYNFFFAEHYTRLKPQYYGQEREISKQIGVMWGSLTEAEKQVYQDKAIRDKERYQAEMMEYRASNGSNA